MEKDRVKKLHVTYAAGRNENKTDSTLHNDEAVHERTWVQRTTLHTIICICILCAALLIRSVDLPLTARIRQGITTALTFDIDTEQTLGRLKFVQRQMEDTVTVFAAQTPESENGRCMPVQGAVLRAYCAEHDHVLLNVQSCQVIAAPAGGSVSDVTDTSIAIDFSDGTCCVITNLGQVSIAKGEQVSCGDAIAAADLQGTPIAFYVYDQGVLIDPVLWAEGEA